MILNTTSHISLKFIPINEAGDLILEELPNLISSKTKLYSNIYSSLTPGGIFLNGDATIPADSNEKTTTYRLWSEFMKSNGITSREVRQHFDDWSKEDTYFSLEEEFSALTSAGFQHPKCLWKQGPMTVFGGTK